MSHEPPYLGQHCVTPYPRRQVLLRWLWAFVQATIFRWSPRPFHTFRARLLVLFGADIPEPTQVVVYPTARITLPWKLTLAPRAMIGPHVNVYNLGHITFARGANVSQSVHLCAGSHDIALWSMPLVTAPIHLGENVWIAADVYVGPGVSIGDLSVVGARSVVVHDLPPGMICIGHPCRPVRERPAPLAK